MPRLSPRALWTARNIHPLLPHTLRATRDLDSAKNELRWLQQHVADTSRGRNKQHISKGDERWLKALCVARSKGHPLQYLLGSEFFGELEIQCEPGVLIPRYVFQTASDDIT